MGARPGRVTVVIPVWGSYVELLPQAVASAHDGGLAPHVIIVDNASEPPVDPPDGCELVRSHVRLSRGAARNLGLSFVRTEYVVFLDADDLLLPGALSRLVDGFDGCRDLQAFVGAIVEFDGTPHRIPRVVARILARASRPFAWLNAIWSQLPTQGCAVMRTQAVRDCGGYPDASDGEDWVLGASLAFRGRIAFDREPVLVYRLRPDSPGADDTPPSRVLFARATRVRGRLRTDPRIRAGRLAVSVLAVVQVLAVVVVRPLVRGTRAARARVLETFGSRDSSTAAGPTDATC